MEGDDLSPWPHLSTTEAVAKLAVYLTSDDAEMDRRPWLSS